MPQKNPILACCTAAALLCVTGVPATAMDCSELVSIRVADTDIVSADTIADGAFSPPGGGGRFGGSGRQAYAELPAFCRVVAVGRPGANSAIGIEVWLPATTWNGKLQAVGNGAWAGSIGHSSMAGALAEGFAVAATDTGHQRGGADFLLDNEDAVIDFAYRAVHQMAVTAKALVEAYYEQPALRAYFNGCSTGGRQALTSAQRYPDDFDGIVAGAPAYYPSHIQGTQVWIAAVSNRSDRAKLATEQFSLLNQAAIAACDTLDAVADGVIENPRQCDFDPGVLACSATGNDASCLNPEQVETARLIYQGPTDASGTSLYPGLEPGSETGWTTLSGAEPLALARETYALLVHEPGWDWRNFDADSEFAIAVERIGALMDSADPDLSAFIEHGGKLLLYHGWSDPGIPPQGTVQYVESVRDTLDPALADQNVRLFMVPGMGHCSGGTGTDRFDMIATLDAWFESGSAPDRVDASRVVNGETLRTRPLCAWPATASYDGSGSTDDAANFSCR